MHVRPGPGWGGAPGIICAFALGLLASSAAAQEPLADDPLLARLERESLAALSELAARKAELRALREQVPQAGALPDPVLRLGIQNDGFSSIAIGEMETSFASASLSQTFPWFGKRGLREDIAALGADRSEQALQRARLSTVADVRRAYLGLLLARDRLRLLAELEAVWRRTQGAARARYEAGQAPQSDVLRAQLEQSRLRQQQLALQAEEQTYVQALNRLRGAPLDAPLPTSRRMRELVPEGDAATRFSPERALEESPELASARLATTAADRAVALARRSAYPDLQVGAGYMYRGELPPMWSLSVGGALPVYAGSKQGRAVAENRALRAAAGHQALAVEQVLLLRTRERRTSFEALRATIELYEHGLLEQSRATVESTLAQYQVGRAGFASVLEAGAGLIADEEAYLQAIAAADRLVIAQAEVDLGAGAPATAPAPRAMSAAAPAPMSDGM